MVMKVVQGESSLLGVYRSDGIRYPWLVGEATGIEWIWTGLWSIWATGIGPWPSPEQLLPSPCYTSVTRSCDSSRCWWAKDPSRTFMLPCLCYSGVQSLHIFSESSAFNALQNGGDGVQY
ncbi:hypothetical protein L195_g017962 [Trifolium pratense]|uniref:Uncharacterized protein n=1 Tax=Trifolium pratense TaxID=57577 RepID=A0A2K3MVJ6_TRIPR|nr:hypothetical protein L195_g017962 [Trifolium pratense]